MSRGTCREGGGEGGRGGREGGREGGVREGEREGEGGTEKWGKEGGRGMECTTSRCACSMSGLHRLTLPSTIHMYTQAPESVRIVRDQ